MADNGTSAVNNYLVSMYEKFMIYSTLAIKM